MEPGNMAAILLVLSDQTHDIHEHKNRKGATTSLSVSAVSVFDNRVTIVTTTIISVFHV